MRKYNKDSKLFITILILVGILAIGYATLGANLKINGVAEVPASSWSVQFKTGSINVTEGSVPIAENTNEKAATIDSANQVSYQVRLPLPGDFYEFTVVVENTGSIDAMIDSISSKLGNTEIVSGTLPSYLDYKVTYSDGVEIAPKHLLAANTEETYKIRLEFKKDITANDLPAQAETLNLNFQVNYVQADSTAIEVLHPKSFATDSWETIIGAAKRGNTSVYSVGSTKPITLNIDLDEDGTPEDHTYTLRVANNSTPPECALEGFSQTACGFVLEFTDDLLRKRMNPYSSGSLNQNINGNGSKGGWEYSELRTYVNESIYNSFPEQIKNMIINTDVVSGHGYNDANNFLTIDKIYLFSPCEIWEDVDGDSNSGIDYYDSSCSNTRQLDYYRNHYVTTENYDFAKKKFENAGSLYWLRSVYNIESGNTFFIVDNNGKNSRRGSEYSNGVSPAFRLG